MDLEHLLVKAVAKKKGISEEEAKQFLEAIKGTDAYEEVKQSIAQLVDLSQLQQQLPAQMQPFVTPLMFQALSPSSSTEKIAERVAMVAAAIRAAYGDDSRQLIEDLRKEIRELKEEKERRELENTLNQTMEAFKQYVQRLEERIMLLEQQSTPREKEEDELDRFERYLEKVRRHYEKARKLGIIDDGRREIDPEQAAQLLRSYGYRVDPPPSYEQMRRMLEEELKKREAEIRKRVEEELGVQERKMTMLMELGVALLDGIVSAFSGGGQQQGISEVRRFISQVKAMTGGGGGGSSEEGGGDLNAGGERAGQADTAVG